MKTQEISRDEWPRFFDTFSHQNQGRPITLEVFGTEIGDQIEERELALEGITAELSDGGGRITIMIGPKRDDHVTHSIVAPIKVSVEQTEQGVDAALFIKSADGNSALLRFRSEVLPELIDAAIKVEPEKLPGILDVMSRLDDLTYTASDGTEVTLHHTGTSLHPGSINVEINKQNRGAIRTDGSFSASPDIAKLLRELNLNPRSVLEKSGHRTGKCAICRRRLTNPVSIARGMGPVCAAKFGW